MKILLIVFLVIMSSCASVVVLKTGKGFHEPTSAGDIDVLTSMPANDFEELGVISASNFNIDQIGKMHNAMRDKAATLGADAVIITNQGQGLVPGAGLQRWAEGTAIKWLK